jgi:hypothetical protein
MMAMRSIDMAEVITRPYPHVAANDVLLDYAELTRAFPPEERFGPKIRMHGDLTHNDSEYIRLIEGEDSYNKLHNWVYSSDFIESFLRLFDKQIEKCVVDGDLLFDPRTLPIRPAPYERRDDLIGFATVSDEAFLFPRLDLGIGKLNYGLENGGGGIHVDNLTRLISILVYIDENPDMVGGEHRLYRLEDYTPVIEKIYPARGNFMVASLQSNRALHDVNPVTAIKGVRKAMYMAVSCSAEIWRPDPDVRLRKLTKSRYRAPAPVRAARSVARFARGVIGR